MDIQITSKLTTQDIALVQGEHQLTTIRFIVPRIFDGKDLTGLTWEVRGVNICADTFYITALTPKEGPEAIALPWTVDENYTGKPGELCVILTGRQGDELRAKFVLSGVVVHVDFGAKNSMAPNYFEDVIQQTQDNADRAEAAAARAPIIDSGNWWIWDVEQGVYVDSGEPAQGDQGLQGEKGDTGTGLQIKGTYETVASLQAGVPSPATGDMYNVGASAPFNIYMWNGGAWEDQGQLQGMQGEKGDTGEQGPKGDTGDAGPQGEQGPQGVKGDAGSPGPQGEQGAQGDQGPQGIQGPQGEVGPGLKVLDYYSTLTALQQAVPAPNAGDAYGVGAGAPYNIYIYSAGGTWIDNGILQGPEGERGPQGAQGAQGPQGERGVPGKDGEDGVKGDKGDTGPEGPMGPQGVKGDKGDTGDRGPIGETGSVGPAGSPGPQGDTGEQGPAGKDAQELSLQVSDTYVQWKRENDAGWTNLISIAQLTGPAGTDARDIEVGASATHIQWRYVGEETWYNIVPLAAITGPPGIQGPPGPNQLTTATETNLTGLIKGNGITVAAAIPGTDYAPAHHAAQHATGGVDALTQTAQATLTAPWSGSAQVLIIPGVTPTSLMGLSDTANQPQREAARKAQLTAAYTGENTVTVTADGETPTIDLPCQVIIWR